MTGSCGSPLRKDLPLEEVLQLLDGHLPHEGVEGDLPVLAGRRIGALQPVGHVESLEGERLLLGVRGGVEREEAGVNLEELGVAEPVRVEQLRDRLLHPKFFQGLGSDGTRGVRVRGVVGGEGRLRRVPALDVAALLALLALSLGTLSSLTTFGVSPRLSRHCDCFCENGSTPRSPTLPELDSSASCASLLTPSDR